PGGKPVATAQVAVFAPPGEERHEGEPRQVVSARVGTDAQGAYQLKVPRATGMELYPTILAARAPGFDVGLAAVGAGTGQKELVIRLPPEQIRKGRFIDLQGTPVKDLTVYVGAVYEKRGEKPVGIMEPAKPSPAWFEPVKTDEQGRFQFR